MEKAEFVGAVRSNRILKIIEVIETQRWSIPDIMLFYLDSPAFLGGKASSIDARYFEDTPHFFPRRGGDEDLLNIMRGFVEIKAVQWDILSDRALCEVMMRAVTYAAVKRTNAQKNEMVIDGKWVLIWLATACRHYCEEKGLSQVSTTHAVKDALGQAAMNKDVYALLAVWKANAEQHAAKGAVNVFGDKCLDQGDIETAVADACYNAACWGIELRSPLFEACICTCTHAMVLGLYDRVVQAEGCVQTACNDYCMDSERSNGDGVVCVLVRLFQLLDNKTTVF